MPTFQQNPVDAGLNVAVKHMARRLHPTGWDQVKRFDEAPTTLDAVLAYYQQHGRVCIAEEDSDGTIYDCADTNHHLRAWHDAVHVIHCFAFNAAGEAAAVYVQIAQLAAVYGINDRTRQWVPLLMADILGLVHYHHRTNGWPMDKRTWTLNEATRWTIEAGALLDVLEADDPSNYEATAIERARLKWGFPWELDA